jgi:hypothetical protein
MTAFDLEALKAADTATMTVLHPLTGEPTTWQITFAGPAHPKAIALSNRLARKRLGDERLREQAAANGRKWKAAERLPEEIREENVRIVAERMLGWTPVRINGADLPFTEEAAVRLLLDPAYGRIYDQVLEFLGADDSFLSRPAEASSTVPRIASASTDAPGTAHQNATP